MKKFIKLIALTLCIFMLLSMALSCTSVSDDEDGEGSEDDKESSKEEKQSVQSAEEPC